METGFCHLHVHTEYSLLDSLCRIEEMLDEAVRSGMEALAITDHHNLSGAIMYYQKAREAGIKPVIGVELNIGTIMRDDLSRTYHVTALAKNNLGYSNLLHLLTCSNLASDGIITRSMLEEHKQGLILLSGCRESELDTALLTDYAHAKEIALEYRNILGQNNYYLELQRTGLPGEEEQIRTKVRLARELNLPLAATNNVHYLRREDAGVHQILSAVQRLSFEEIYPKKVREEYYFKGALEMQALFQDLPEALANTVHIAERCNVFLDFEQRPFPRFPVPGGLTAETFLHNCCLGAVSELYGSTPPDSVLGRLESELVLINQSGYAGYFLIIWDVVWYARSQGIFVAGRGSAAGSLVCYLLGITPVNPLSYGLKFERFLTPGQTTLPDIALDIDYLGRKIVIRYLRERYGEGNVAHIAIVNPLASLSLLRDVAMAQGWPKEQWGLLAKFINNENIHQVDALTNSSEFKQAYGENPAFRKLIDCICKLDGLPRHLTTHPTGLVITQDSLANYTPLQYARNGEVITQYDFRAIQTLGLFKLDLPGVRFLTALRWVSCLLTERGQMVSGFAGVPLDDQKTYRLLQRGDTVGCFELEAEPVRKMLQKVKPVDILEIGFATVLAHFPAGDSSVCRDFLARLHEVQEVEYPHPALSDILEETYGIILFQEQAMEILHRFGGIEPEEAIELRRAMLQKDRLKVAEYKCTFVKGATACGLTAAEANYVYDKLYRNVKLIFCKAHVIAYAWLAYLSAYCKAHYPVEYFTGLLNAHVEMDYRFRRYLREARYHQVAILSVDINRSGEWSGVHDGQIRLGLNWVKGVGEKGAGEICEKRQAKEFSSLEDFCQRIDGRLIQCTAIENLIKVGAFDAFGQRRDLLKTVEKIFA